LRPRPRGGAPHVLGFRRVADPSSSSRYRESDRGTRFDATRETGHARSGGSRLTRTPLGRSVATLATVQTIACQRGVEAPAIRAEWARAGESARRDVSARGGTRSISRRGFLAGGGAAVAWLGFGSDPLHAATAPPPAKKTSPRKPSATIAIVGAGLGG